MNEEVKKQSMFHQTRANQAKLGAYYTDLEHCRWISRLLDFPEEEVCCLEPAIGNAEAVINVTNRGNNSKVHIFGVDLNQESAEICRKNSNIEECLWGDFLTDVIIGEKQFSFCFANPPYGESDGRRLETKFLKKIIPCLKIEAIIVYVVPQYVAAEKLFLTAWIHNFTTEAYYRFHESEYEKWQQIVLIGKKRRKEKRDPNKVVDMQDIFKNKENFELLPMNGTDRKISVLPSYNKEVTQFTTKTFDAQRALQKVSRSSLSEMVSERIKQPKYLADDLMRPPIMPNAGQMYLMAISGAGQGRVGTKEGRDLHLQRGCVKNVEESEIREGENGKPVEAVQQYTRINFCIIENNGRIHRL
ncbi:MAG: DUF6094 domain-containing protein [Hespellia sp.]|nr:DUF6094 domain-containing protein [Hespellia sp.]